MALLGKNRYNGVALAERRKRLEAKTKEDKLASFPRRRRREVEQARKLFQENPQEEEINSHQQPLTVHQTATKQPTKQPLNSTQQQPISPQTATKQPLEKGKGKGQQPSTEFHISSRDSSPASQTGYRKQQEMGHGTAGNRGNQGAKKQAPTDNTKPQPTAQEQPPNRNSKGPKQETEGLLDRKPRSQYTQEKDKDV
ncbi:hypothetical protein M5K25_009663 [Dendrobium thyrsiflorum]|uniref:Uncharacterized protein n=1 Tax=Dendrobium thyrsiflorum TaxID=117978 RepID=A0ABD0V617_DENTH